MSACVLRICCNFLWFYRFSWNDLFVSLSRVEREMTGQSCVDIENASGGGGVEESNGLFVTVIGLGKVPLCMD